MRIFVAGASGAIGTRLVPQLLERGHEVVVVVITGTGTNEVVIGSGRYIASHSPGTPGRSAEVAFLVAKDYQGLGIAGRLLAQMTELARRDGIAAFDADVLAEPTEPVGAERVPVRGRCGGADIDRDVRHPERFGRRPRAELGAFSDDDVGRP